MKTFIILLLSSITPGTSSNDSNNATILIKKCCGVNYIMRNDICIFDNSTNLIFPVYENEIQITVNISFVYNSTQCTNDTEENYENLRPNIYTDQAFFVQTDGKLWLPANNTFIDNDQYCIEYFEEVGVSAIVCSGVFEQYHYTEPGPPAGLIGMALSLPFLLVTFTVYALLPEQNLHGKFLMCYVFALFWSFFLMTLSYFWLETIHDNLLVCHMIGKLAFFFFTSSFFWMNAISFNIWLTFSGIKGFSVKKNIIPDRKRFLIYSIYAWGVPLLLIIFYICLNYVLPSDVWYNPGVGCWILVDIRRFFIFYGPIGILITINVIFFVITAWKIKQVKKQISLFKDKDSRKHFKNEDKQRLYLYLKLLFGMGINWSMEVIRWVIYLLGGHIPYVVDSAAGFCDAAYGVFIFFIFVFKKSIWNSLKRRYYVRVENQAVHTFGTTKREINLSKLTTVYSSKG